MKEFTAPEVEAPVFKIGERVIKCVAELPGWILAEFDDHERIGAALTIKFLRACVEDEDEFDAVLKAKTPVVGAKMLADIFSWLLSEYSGRPTLPPSDSSDGASTTVPTSKGGSSEPGNGSAISISKKS